MKYVFVAIDYDLNVRNIYKYIRQFKSFMTEAVIIKKANQWAGFYMITASIMKELSLIYTISEV